MSKTNLLLTSALLTASAALCTAQQTLVVDTPEMAGISGFRWMWNEPVALSADGPTQRVNHGQFGQAPSVFWATRPHNVKHGQIPLRDENQPGALVFDAVHRSMLVRFPNAADTIAERLAKGFEIRKVELVLPFKGTELWPEGYRLPGGMSFLGDQWAKSTPRWHAVAWALRKPWTADSETGPTFNAWMNGVGYWTRCGAQDTENDRIATA